MGPKMTGVVVLSGTLLGYEEFRCGNLRRWGGWLLFRKGTSFTIPDYPYFPRNVLIHDHPPTPWSTEVFTIGTS